jgi:TonB family protein
MSALLFPAAAAAQNSAPPSAAGLPDSEPALKSWKPAAFPPGLPATVTHGKATARIVIDENGVISSARVLKASDPAFGQAALEAAMQCVFTPGVDKGKYIAMCLDIPYEFDRLNGGALPMGSLQMAPQKPAAVEDTPIGEFPPTLVGRGLPGRVLFGCRVNPDGSSSGLRILVASHADFVLPAIESSKNWRFTPAKQGDLTVASDLRGEVFYSDTQTPPREQVLAANGITAPDGGAPTAAPELIKAVDPVYPYDLLLAGKEGSASVEFTVTGGGAIRDVHVREASDPAFGAALVAAMLAWQFEGATVHGQGTDVTLVKHADFKAVPKDATADAADWQARLVALLRKDSIGGGRGLDERLMPIYQAVPVPPEGAETKTQVQVEFVIDRDGRARLPRVTSATNEAYGWAAATAISQWIFKAPTRGGKPTEVKVQVPLVF